MPLADDILRLTQKHGGMEERQLLSRWESDLRQFLAPFEREILQGHQVLEIGLENRLVLKLVVKRRATPPIAGLLRLIPHLPKELQQIAKLAAQCGMDFHVGLRLNADSSHREIYVYDHPELAKALPPHPCNLPDSWVVTAWGVDERQGLSAYCTSQRNPRLLERMRPINNETYSHLRIDLSPHFQSTWLHYRLLDGHWTESKFGVEYKEIPLPTLARLLSVVKLPYFSYLIPRKTLRQLVLGGTRDGTIGSYYFTVT